MKIPSSIDSYLLSQLLQRANLGDPSQDPNQDVSAQPQDASQNQPIVVTGRQTPAQGRQPSLPVNYPDAPRVSLSNGPDAPDYGNRAQVEAARAAVANDRKPQSKLHSILDNIGDALLMANGNEPIHKNNRDEEDLQNSMVGFTDNPRAAFERANTVNSKFAQEAYKNYQDNQYHQGQLQSLNSSRQSEIDNRAFDNRDKGMTRVMQWAYGGMPYDRIVNAAKSYGISENDLQQMGVTPTMTPEDRKAFAYGAMNVNQQVQVPFKEQSLDIAQQNANANKEKADKYQPYSPPPRQPRAQTELEYFQQIGGKDPSQRTAAEKDFYKKYTQGTKGSRLGGITPPPAPGAPSRFRILKVQ